ncbi:MAG: alginate lyase family protein [Pseudomonadales bacterium]|nr:alginate lyase family protein [Pseudomonadales bacterium]
MVFAGTLFKGDEADNWRRKGLSLITRELKEQILADGGHFERSPMYHAIVLEDLLDLVQLARCYPTVFSKSDVGEWYGHIGRMLRWLAHMSHPDGEIAFFNDAALDVAPNLSALNDYSTALGLASVDKVHSDLTTLEQSGYVRAHNSDSVLICDVGKIGPDYLPGHAHADTLSFELSVHGQRVLVNSGTGCYGEGPDRLYQRSTAAHNTVVVDGQDSSEVWAGFRVARRAYPRDLKVNRDGEDVVIDCSHDGYRRLPGRVIHRRTWRFTRNALVVSDDLTGEFQVAIAHFYFHPDVDVILDDKGQSGTVRLFDGDVVDFKVDVGLAELRQAEHYPRFGHTIENWCLAVPLQGAHSQVVFTW